MLNPAMDRPEVQADLAGIRREEMARAREILGVEQRFLGFVDSGLPEGTRCRRCPRAASRLVTAGRGGGRRWSALVREFRPHVILTYDESGGYPHPDHIKTHQVAVEAFEAAADPDRYPEAAGEPWQPLQDVLLRHLPPGEVRRAARELVRRGLDSPYSKIFAEWEERARKRMERGDRPLEITTRVACGRLLRHPRRRAARARHPDRPGQLLVRLPARRRARRVADRGLSSC